jgi:hypothetical protein
MPTHTYTPLHTHTHTAKIFQKPPFSPFNEGIEENDRETASPHPRGGQKEHQLIRRLRPLVLLIAAV